MSNSELATIKKMVYEHCGLLLEGIAEERLRKAVDTKMKAAACTNFKAYRQLISQDGQAFNDLVNQLTVNETYFFREAEQIELLVKVLVPQILAKKSPSAEVRILSAGCSSGEEPYSLAIALREALGAIAAKKIHLDAGDLDQEILKKAQHGLYSDFSFRGVNPELRKRYFKPQTQGHQLIPEIRQLVSFHQLNLLAPVYPKQLGNYDIIFFRNVSIYFDLETRRLIQHKFYNLMEDNAILLLGSSETLGNDLGVFELVEQQNQYYFIKGDDYRPSQPLKPTAELTSELTRELTVPLEINLPTQVFQSQPSIELVAPALPDIKTIQQLVADGEQERALQLLDQLLASNTELQAARLIKSWLLINNKKFSQAEVLLEEAFTADPWSVDAMLMQGLSYKWQQQIEEATQWFKKAIYSYPECWSAHYYLADIYRNENQPAAAIRSYQTLLRILAVNPKVTDGTEWIPLSLPVAHVIFLSQRHLEQLMANSSEVES